MSRQYNSLAEFYPYYLTEHQNFTCQVLHFIGTSLFFGLLAYALFTAQYWLLALLPVAGYGFAWAGHFFFEKNKPATFQYPLYSLASDFIMYFHIITFQLPKKMKAAKAKIS